MSAPRLSLVVATFNRPDSLERLLRELAAQTLPKAEFEVVVVDDGSTPPVEARLRAHAAAYPLRVVTQANAGAADGRASVRAARKRMGVLDMLPPVIRAPWGAPRPPRRGRARSRASARSASQPRAAAGRA